MLCLIVLSSFSARLRSSILRAGLELEGPPLPPNVSTPSTQSVILAQLTTHFSWLRLIIIPHRHCTLASLWLGDCECWLFNTEVSRYSGPHSRTVRASPVAVSLRLRLSGAPHSTARPQSLSALSLLRSGKCSLGSPDGEREAGRGYLSETNPDTPSLVARRYYSSVSVRLAARLTNQRAGRRESGRTPVLFCLPGSHAARSGDQQHD